MKEIYGEQLLNILYKSYCIKCDEGREMRVSFDKLGKRGRVIPTITEYLKGTDIKDGKEITFYKNRKIRSITYYFKGKKQCDKLTYNRKGILRMKVFYANGNKQGPLIKYTGGMSKSICYYHQGKVVWWNNN